MKTEDIAFLIFMLVGLFLLIFPQGYQSYIFDYNKFLGIPEERARVRAPIVRAMGFTILVITISMYFAVR